MKGLLIMNEQKSLRRAGVFDEEIRRQWQDPDVVLMEIGLKPGVTFIDVGCGEGFFTLPVVRLVGEKGRVYGLDVNPQAIERLRIKAANESITNLKLRVGIETGGFKVKKVKNSGPYQYLIIART